MKKRFLSIFMAISMVLTTVPTVAWAEDTQPQEPAVNSGEPAVFSTTTGASFAVDVSDMPSNDEIFAAYVENAFYGYGIATFGRAAGDSLSGDTKIAYDKLVEIIKEIAAGERTSAKVAIGQDLTSAGYPADVVVSFSGQQADFDRDENLNIALLSDLPYDLYWFDKTYQDLSDPSNPVYGFSYQKVYGSDGALAQVIFTFQVAEAYRGNTYSVEAPTVSGTTASITTAVNNAKEIVEQYEGKTDLEKLEGYRDAICDLVDYNTAAAETPDTPYGDPWQMIYVFDGDPDTKVVCEGYAKAFQYLCDMSDFSGDVECYTVTGYMDGGTGAGAHMWNIVKMEDGKYYLVDVTNSEEGTVGQGGELFLGGTSGSPTEGYTFSADESSIEYTYDIDTRDFWGTDASSILNLSSTAYDPDAEPTTYAINFTAPTNGQVEVNIADTTAVAANTTVTLTVTPDTGYELGTLAVKDANGNNVAKTDNGDGTYTFTMPASNVTVTVTFVEEGSDVIIISEVSVVMDGTPADGGVETTCETDNVNIDVAWDPAFSGTFEEDTVYTATITMTPQEGYTFDPDNFGLTLEYDSPAGKRVGDPVVAADGTSATVQVRYRVLLEAILDITGAPATGAAESTVAINPATAHADMSYAWAPALENGKFAAETAYTLTITLTAEDGYIFDGSRNVSADFGDLEVSFAEDGSWAEIVATYAKTAEITADLALNVAQPAVMEAPVTTGETNVEGVTVTNVTWAPNDAKFKKDTPYTVTFQLNIDEAVVMEDEPVVTVNGQEAEYDSSAKTVTYTFSAMEGLDPNAAVEAPAEALRRDTKLQTLLGMATAGVDGSFVFSYDALTWTEADAEATPFEDLIDAGEITADGQSVWLDWEFTPSPEYIDYYSGMTSGTEFTVSTKYARTLSFETDSVVVTWAEDLDIPEPVLNDDARLEPHSPVVYTSSDKTIATVDASGNVTPVKAGTVTITASAEEDPLNYAAAVPVSYTLTINKAQSTEKADTVTEVEKTHETITVVNPNAAYEYACVPAGETLDVATAEWIADGAFTGLTEDTEYDVYARVAETDNYYASSVASDPYTVKTLIAPPTFTPNGGTFRGSVTVTLTAGEGNEIYYTTNGTDPVVGADGTTKYDAETGIMLQVTTTVKAIAVKADGEESVISSALFRRKTSASSDSSTSGTETGGGTAGGGAAESGTTTETNSDGSETTTETAKDGTVTETTTYPDGSKEVVVEAPDGTVTTTETDAEGNVTETVENPDGSTVTTVEKADGTSIVTKEDENGKVEATVDLSENAVTKAQGEPIVLDMNEIPVEDDSDEAATVSISVPEGESADVIIPLDDADAGTVVVVVNPDGTETVIRNVVADEDGVAINVTGDATVKIIDNSKDFDDVSRGDWYNDAVKFASSHELFSGVTATTFGPTHKMTRGMLAVVLHNLEHNPTAAAPAAFSDVSGEYFANAVAWAAGERIISGYGDGNFGPNDNITREQLAVMLYRFAGSPAVSGSLNFADADNVSSYAVNAMIWAVQNGIISGKGENMLDPQGLATRAEVASMLMRYCKA